MWLVHNPKISKPLQNSLPHTPSLAILAFPRHPSPGVHLYDLLHNPLNRTWAQRNIFGHTDRVHRLVNVADRSCEAGSDGMALTLAAACEEVIKDGLLAKTLAPAKGPFPPAAASVHFRFETMLVPAFRKVANARLQVLERNLTSYERNEMARGHPVDRFANPLVARPVDTKLGSRDTDTRAAARIALRQVLQTYAAADLVETSALLAIAG